MVDGHGAVVGFLRNLHPEETSGGEQFLLRDRGLISKRDVKILEDLGEEASKRKKFVKVVVGDKRKDNGGVVDRKSRVDAIDKFGEIF